MQMTRFYIIFLLCFMFVLNARAQDLPSPDCSNIQTFSATHGVAFEVTMFHGIYPKAVQSQTCDNNTKITDMEYDIIQLNLIHALGCAADTGVYKEFAKLLSQKDESAKLIHSDINKIPQRYLSPEDNFCQSERLVALKNCGSLNHSKCVYFQASSKEEK